MPVYVATPSEVHVMLSSYKAFNPAFDSFFATSNTLLSASVLPFPYQICDQARQKSTVKVMIDNIINYVVIL